MPVESALNIFYYLVQENLQLFSLDYLKHLSKEKNWQVTVADSDLQNGAAKSWLDHTNVQAVAVDVLTNELNEKNISVRQILLFL